MLFARGGDKEKVGCGDKPGLSKIVAVGKVEISPVISLSHDHDHDRPDNRPLTPLARA